jgi:hypothetical protein
MQYMHSCTLHNHYESFKRLNIDRNKVKIPVYLTVNASSQMSNRRVKVGVQNVSLRTQICTLYEYK